MNNILFMKKRNVVAVILLPLVTCGIYAIYWYFAAFGELKDQFEQEFPGMTVPSPVMSFFLGLITCGIYSIYAMYQYAKAAEMLAQKRGVESFSPVLIVILTIFVPILPQMFLQMEFNNIVDASLGNPIQM